MELFSHSRAGDSSPVSQSKFGWSELWVCGVLYARQIGVGAHLGALVGLSFDRNFKERSIGDGCLLILFYQISYSSCYPGNIVDNGNNSWPIPR